MATIGMRDLYYAMITEDNDGNETYGTPVKLAPAMTAALSTNFQEASLYADDALEDYVKEFSSGTISLGVSDIGAETASKLTGAKVDSNGVLVNNKDDDAPYVAIGFRAKTSKGKYRYVWLYRVKFAVPNDNFNTKGDSITFNTPTIEGTFTERKKATSDGSYPWKAAVTEGDEGVSADTIKNWFKSVYEPTYAAKSK